MGSAFNTGQSRVAVERVTADSGEGVGKAEGGGFTLDESPWPDAPGWKPSSDGK